MAIIIKPMETDEEIRGKAFVHWKSWHDTYSGLINRDYLDKLTLAKCEELAFRWRDRILTALDGGRIVGFVGYGTDTAGEGEIFALYILSDYYGTGLGIRLLDAALDRLNDCSHVGLWVLKNNRRAIRFYEKRGFRPTGEEKAEPLLAATEIRMVRDRL